MALFRRKKKEEPKMVEPTDRQIRQIKSISKKNIEKQEEILNKKLRDAEAKLALYEKESLEMSKKLREKELKKMSESIEDEFDPYSGLEEQETELEDAMEGEEVEEEIKEEEVEEEEEEEVKENVKPEKKQPTQPRINIKVVKELQVQQVRQTKEDDGTITGYMTIEEALQSVMIILNQIADNK